MSSTTNLLAALALLGGCMGTIDSPGADGSQVQPDDGDLTPQPEIARLALPILRGVDRASELSTSEARRLHDDHGVRWTGVYIGGPCNGGSGWTKGGVEAIAKATGWKFMPIYVGQQASSVCGAHHLTYGQGHADGLAAVHRMRAFGWGRDKDIPVALDVEAPTYFDHETASTSYVRGWVNAVHHEGYRAYVYGSPYALNHYHDAKVRIDAVWAASYFYSGFRNVKPGALDQMGGRYRHSNRAWQYAGDFHVSGAGDIDADTSHLLLAPRPGGSNRTLTAKRDVPASCGVLEVGDGVARGESVASCDGSTVLTMSDEGELSLVENGHTVWTAGTDGAGAVAVLEDTGELIVADDDGNTVFTSGTAGFPLAHATLDAQGLTLVDDDQTPLWTDRQGTLVNEDTEADLDQSTDVISE